MSAVRQRGAAALLTVLLLCGLALLASLYAHRALLAELRGAEVQRRSAQALEAAESGLQWALVQLNAGSLDDACRPSSEAAGRRLRDRLIEYADDGRLAPRLSDTGTPWSAGCTLDAAGAWSCRCGGDGAPASADEAPSFSVQAEAGARTGLLRLVSRGCVGCQGGERDARAQVSTLLAFVPALTGLPAAPLVVAGALRLDPLAPRLAVRERDQRGLLIHAGGAVQAPALVLPDGVTAAELSSLTAQDDPALALVPGRFLHAFLGLDPADLARAPGVRTLRCGGDCAEALRTAVAGGAQALWIEGELALPAGVVLGSVDAPVLLAVQGQARLGPGVVLHGLLAAGALHWQARSGGDVIRGALLVAGDCCDGSGAPTVERDTALLRRLARQAGRYVRVPGGWRDFD
ncbi:hypothetical protein [Azohydromonas caseinilytica]|uniref:PilX N-terminal n=1 Tax=Azohydromonas caseinilytica TaxID=2728836 RepID=A0A848F3Q3_9BURK|nr:hypothetical protein [Azohydromonas caseinilytica]NML14717.1 hypothetical protein [Azohydromonas caseinilytica]